MDDDGWIEWEGGECPVEPEDLVQVQYLNEARSRSERFSPKRAATKKWAWTTVGHGVSSRANIIAYRVVKPSSPTRSLIE